MSKPTTAIFELVKDPDMAPAECCYHCIFNNPECRFLPSNFNCKGGYWKTNKMKHKIARIVGRKWFIAGKTREELEAEMPELKKVFTDMEKCLIDYINKTYYGEKNGLGLTVGLADCVDKDGAIDARTGQTLRSET